MTLCQIFSVYQRSKSGKDVLSEQVVEIPALLKAVIPIVLGQANDRGIELETFASPIAVRGDPRKLKQIIVNLLSNAIKFTDAGGKVGVRASLRDDQGLRLLIEDTGIGIASNDIPTVLSPFGQVGDLLMREHEGAGIGLPLTKALTEQHGGSLTLSSEVGAGTTVTVDFPPERTVGRDLEGATKPSATPEPN